MAIGRPLALLLLCAFAAAAQRVDLYGRVLDTSEGGIGQADVTAVNEDTGFRRMTQSDPGGMYAVGSLQPGTYKVTVRREGFRTLMRFGVRLSPSGATRADFILPVGSIEETITVYGTAPLIGHDDASTGTRVERGDFETLPLNGRGLLTLLELAPGTNVVPATRGDAGQFTATGQRPNTNYFTVDGVSANTGVTAGGLPAQPTGGSLPALSAFGSMDSLISLEAVQEMRVTTSTSVAEFGRLPGATVGLSSRSGSNEFHGAAAYRVRASRPGAGRARHLVRPLQRFAVAQSVRDVSRQQPRCAIAEPHARTDRPCEAESRLRFPGERVAGDREFRLDSRRSVRASAAHHELHRRPDRLRAPRALFDRRYRPTRFGPGGDAATAPVAIRAEP